MLALKNKRPVILPPKTGLFGNNRELQSGTSQLLQIYRQVPRTKGRTALILERRMFGKLLFINKSESIEINWEFEV